MTSKTTFYFSRITGCKIHDIRGSYIGKIIDLAIDLSASGNGSPVRPRVSALKIKTTSKICFIDFADIEITKKKGKYSVHCTNVNEIIPECINECLFLGESILDRQIVDINGRKVVRVNDIRLVAIPSGVYALAVDVGLEGLLRRIGIVRPVRFFFSLFDIKLPSNFILWDDVAAVDYTNLSIKLSKTSSKLHTLHPSDLADIIEDLGKASMTNVFSSLDEEKAADVLEELETPEQIHIIESLPVEKAADVLEKMPANEAADILDVLEEDKAEALLKEMESETSEEVRELLEYPDTKVGSIMTTDVMSFSENITIEEVLREIRQQKPEMEMLYNLFVTDKEDKLIATLSLRDLVISEPDVPIKNIMKKDPVKVYDEDKLDSLAEIISKYNLLAIPVTDNEEKLEGMVVIDDIVEDLIGKRRTK